MEVLKLPGLVVDLQVGSIAAKSLNSKVQTYPNICGTFSHSSYNLYSCNACKNNLVDTSKGGLDCLYIGQPPGSRPNSQ